MSTRKENRITLNLSQTEMARLVDLQEREGFPIPAHAARYAINRAWMDRELEPFDAIITRVDRNMTSILRALDEEADE